MLLSSSNRKYQPYTQLSYFSVVVHLRCLLHHILLLIVYIYFGKTGILFSLSLCSLWWVKIVGYVLARWSCSFVCILHHVIIIIVQTYLKTLNLKMPVRYILSSVRVRLSIFSQLSIIRYMYGAVCFMFTHFPCDDWDNIHFVLLSSSNRKYGLWSIGHETMVCAVCLSIFFWIETSAVNIYKTQ